MVHSSGPVVCLVVSVVSGCFWLCLVVSCCNQLHLFASDCCRLSLVASRCTQLCLVVVLSLYLLLLPAVSCGILLCLIAPSCPICLVVSALQFDPIPSGCVQLVPGVCIYVWLFNGVYG
jgi:hypothetical protein